MRFICQIVLLIEVYIIKHRNKLGIEKKKSSISHLIAFRSIAYAHMSYQKLLKLDDKSGIYIFIG